MLAFPCRKEENTALRHRLEREREEGEREGKSVLRTVCVLL